MTTRAKIKNVEDDEIITEAKTIAAALGTHAPDHTTSPMIGARGLLGANRRTKPTANSQRDKSVLSKHGDGGPGNSLAIQNPAPEIVIRTTRPGLCA